MTVVTGIMRGIEIGRKIYQVHQRVDKRLQSISPANQFINRYAPPGLRKPLKKAYRYGEIALGGKLIYDLVAGGIKEDGKIQKPRYTPKYRKTRSNFYNASNGFQRGYKRYTCPSRRRQF